MRKMEKLKILLVDDSPVLLKLGKEVFESDGYDVVGAKDGVEAINLLSRHTIAIIITDILMPNMDGYSLCYNVRNNEKYKAIPIIIYSGTYISQNDEQLALEIGADMYIRKPAAIKFLLDTTKEIIARPRKDNYIISCEHELSEVTRLYSARFIEKLELKNQELEEAQRELLKSEKRFRALVENSYDAIFLRDEKGMIFYQSPGVEKITGYTIDELKEGTLAELIHPEDLAQVLARADMTIKNPGKPVYSMNRMMHKGGYYIWAESITTNLLGDDDIKAIVGNFRDITERKLAEENIIKVSRLYAFISQINQAIVHIPDQSTLFQAACRIAVDIGKFEEAWISIPDTITRKLNLVAYCGMSDGELDMLNNIIYADNGSTGTVLRTGMSFVVNDFDDESVYGDAKRYAAFKGFKSGIALPIKVSGKAIGTYHIFSYKINLFDHEEIRLLEEAAGDISFALDVFEKERHRKKMEDKITQSELRLKQSQAIAHFGSWELEFSRGVAVWSEEFCRIYGVPPSNNLHTFESWISMVHPEDIERTRQIADEGRRTLTNFNMHHRIVRKDGTVRTIYSQAEFLFNAEGIPVALHGVSHDITELKESEIALAQSEANLHQLMDLIPQSIFAKDYNGSYIFVNKAFAALYGLTAEQMINRSINETIPIKGEAAAFLKQDRDVILSGEPAIIPEHPFTDHNGNILIFHTVKVPYTIAGTNKKAALGITIDITERKKAETERANIIADMVQRNNDLEQFSYIISHNLRAPVANILGLVDIMQTIGLKKKEVKEVTAFLQTAAKNLDHVIIDINHILELKNNLNGKREIIDLEHLLSEVKLSIDNRIIDEPVNIICDFSAVPEMTSVKSYLYSIFSNLISNSIKYRCPGILPMIEIKSIKTDNKIQLIFKDNGLGIDLKRCGEEVFGLYKRFHHHVEGKGMGLFMVKTQVELLGGKISVASKVNKGSEFKIQFDKSNSQGVT